MTAFDPRTPFRLDRFLDALVSDEPPPSDAARLDPGLHHAVSTLQRLTAHRQRSHILDLTSRSLPTIASITWEERPMPSPSVKRGHMAALLQSRPVTALATAALLAGIILSGAWALTRSVERQPAASTADYQLILIGEADNALRAIDPETLADLATQPPLLSSPAASPEPGPADSVSSLWRVSADGSTLARAEQAAGEGEWTTESEITIFDSRTGRERSHITLPLPLFGTMQLSGDGSRLAAQIEGGYTVNPIPAAVNRNPASKWNVYDTTTGRLLSTIDASGDRDPLGTGSGWLDANGLRFFRLAIGLDSTYPGPWPAQLVAHDTTTGAEISRLDLPDVRIGSWPTDQPVDLTGCSFNAEGTPVPDAFTEGRIWRSEFPGVAISPDGSTMAIVHPNGRRLTTIDLTVLSVERTVDIAGGSEEQSTPFVDETGDSHCANEEGMGRRANFSIDGTELYVTGFDLTINGDGRQVVHSIGLLRIDLASARVATRLPSTADAVPVFVSDPSQSPDGRYLYVVLYVPEDDHVVLQRLDATTLAVLAERRFDRVIGIAIVRRPT